MPRLAGAAMIVTLAGCAPGPTVTPAISPGTLDRPRAIIILAKDYTFLPAIIEVAPGESVTLQIINGGLAVHEVVIGSMLVQDAWETAEAATAGAPPGPTPEVSVSPDVAGLRVVLQSGQRVDVAWTVPVNAATSGQSWLVGCHIPGHWAEGMTVPIRFLGADGRPLPTGAHSVVP